MQVVYFKFFFFWTINRSFFWSQKKTRVRSKTLLQKHKNGRAFVHFDFYPSALNPAVLRLSSPLSICSL